jgi:hypothetical protein
MFSLPGILHKIDIKGFSTAWNKLAAFGSFIDFENGIVGDNLGVPEVYFIV